MKKIILILALLSVASPTLFVFAATDPLMEPGGSITGGTSKTQSPTVVTPTTPTYTTTLDKAATTDGTGSAVNDYVSNGGSAQDVSNNLVSSPTESQNNAVLGNPPGTSSFDANGNPIINTPVNPNYLPAIGSGVTQNSQGQNSVSNNTNGEYQQLAPLTEPNGNAVQTTDLPTYLKAMYRIGIGACFVLGVVMFTWAGIEYILSESMNTKADAKKRISSALIGLAIALVSYLLLQTINPNLLQLQDLKTAVQVPVSTPVK